jgi:chromosome segregation ATPase
MTDQIQKSISLLRSKFMGIHQNLSMAKKEIDTLNLEIKQLQSDLFQSKERNELLEIKLQKERSEMEAANKQVDNGSALSQGRSNEQIDELVKEIENCIAALKK